MCTYDHFITLIEEKDMRISWCKSCKSFSIFFKSGCASFSKDEFDGFHQLLKSMTEDHYCHEFAGEERAIIKSPLSSFGFSLTLQDTKSLIKNTEEALTLYDAFKVIYG